MIFDGEEAVDAGGVTKEFFLLLLKELMDPVYGMFTHYKESNLLWFSDIVSVCSELIYPRSYPNHFHLALKYDEISNMFQILF